VSSRQDTLGLQVGTNSTTTERDVTAGAPSRSGTVRRVLVAASLVLVAWVAWRAWPEITAAFDVMRTIRPSVLLFALLLEVGAVACLAQVYRRTLNAVGTSVGYAQGLQVSMGAFTLSRVLPGGGAAGAIWAARRLRGFGVPWAKAGTGVVIEGLLAMATLGAIVTAGAIGALFRGHVTARSVVAACVIAAVFAALGWATAALVRSASARGALFAFIERMVPRAQDRVVGWRAALDELALTMPPSRLMLPVVGWSAVNWGLDIAALWVVFAGLGLHMELGVLILGFGVANLVTALPHTPGGLGLVEAGMTGTYVALGIDTSVALAAVLAYRLISFWIPVLLGVPQYLRPPVGAGTGGVT